MNLPASRLFSPGVSNGNNTLKSIAGGRQRGLEWPAPVAVLLHLLFHPSLQLRLPRLGVARELWCPNIDVRFPFPPSCSTDRPGLQKGQNWPCWSLYPFLLRFLKPAVYR